MIERAAFGATGHESTRVIFGAAALARGSKSDADRALELLVEHGINHIDVAASYGDAELRIAHWLRRHEGEFFLATKTGERGYAGAREEIRRSLDRLGVDKVDLIQLHNLVDAVDWEIALGADGALEAAVEAREEGIVRFIGVTGHGLSVPKMHSRSLERFPFDSVLAPYNWRQMQDPRYAETFDELAKTCAEKDVALQTIKSLAYRPWEGRPQTATTWYEPLTEQADIDLAAHWVLGNEQAIAGPSDVTGVGVILGTPNYMAPELIASQPCDGRADQYALACTAFHMLAGAPPYEDSNPAVVISQHVNAPPPSIGARRPELAGLDPVFAAAMAKAPSARFRSCQEFAERLGQPGLGYAGAIPYPDTPPTFRATPPVTDVTVPWKLVDKAQLDLTEGTVRLVFRPEARKDLTWLGSWTELSGEWTDRAVLEAPPR